MNYRYTPVKKKKKAGAPLWLLLLALAALIVGVYLYTDLDIPSHSSSIVITNTTNNNTAELFSVCGTTLQLVVLPSVVVADGLNYSQAVVTVLNETTSLPIAGRLVQISSNHTNLTMAPRTAYSNTDGVVTFNLRSIKAGNSTVLANTSC